MLMINDVIIIFTQALIETTDVHIYNELIRGNEEDTFLKGYSLCGSIVVCTVES